MCFLRSVRSQPSSAEAINRTKPRYHISMQWTDQIRRVKIFLVVAAVIIAVASLLVSHFLIRDLSAEEHKKMETWAEAMRTFSNADSNADLNLVLKVLNGNTTIPVIVMDENKNVQTFRNLSISSCSNYADTLAYVKAEGLRLLHSDKVIKVALSDNVPSDYVYVCYDDSVMLRRLSSYPYVQLGVVMIFVVIAIFALLTSKKAEQNKVWVGLSKETAHQLGTPISSLMAWVEVLKETYPSDELIPEMYKDISRLQLIADRFSKIGSLPELVPTDLRDVMDHVVNYMDRRTSSKIRMTCCFPDTGVIVNINASLFEWVIENLCKNAVDAMSGEGSITITVYDESGRTAIEVSDTGKGIPKKNIGNVFRPGFTTKKRGWGLGLSLAKRIVEEYHHGRIFVKSSEPGRGTTFRIELKK